MTAYHCTECDRNYAIEVGQTIRCPACGSKDRERLVEVQWLCRGCSNTGLDLEGKQCVCGIQPSDGSDQ